MKDFSIATSMRRHALQKKARGGMVENEKLHPEHKGNPLKTSLAEHLLHKMAEGGIVPEDNEHAEMESDSEDFLTSPPELTPEEQGLIEEQKLPTSHEFEIFPEERPKKLSSVFAAMAERRRKG